VARRLAREHGVDLEDVRGTGPNGRITRSDVEEIIGRGDAHGAQTSPAETGSEQEAVATTQTTRVPLSREELLVARRMAESRATIPDFVVETEVDMTAVALLRDRMKQGGAPAPSYNDAVVRASALALRQHPRLNSSFGADEIETYEGINIGIAVAVGKRLLVPIIFGADAKSLSDIAADARRLVTRAREGSITPAELTGGTFTVSNLGMLGVARFEAVIYPRQSAILAVGAVIPKPVAIDQAVGIRPMMSLTLTCDHRVVYGAEAAAFLATVRSNLETSE
jgi:pyruvate dehydrogenase E2 component (dihydrolipoamide acetyltransferase)